jgi:hypothetical protein
LTINLSTELNVTEAIPVLFIGVYRHETLLFKYPVQTQEQLHLLTN